MGARALEARLTLRLLGLTGSVLVAVAVAGVVVTDRVLDASDTAVARSNAEGACDAVERELAEGDPTGEAVGEVVSDSEAQGVRLSVWPKDGTAPHLVTDLPELDPGACATVIDAHGLPWRACGASDPRSRTVAAIPITTHRATVRALSRGMVAVVFLAMIALWIAVRRALRAPIAELSSLVGWTARIAETEIAADPPPTETREIAQLESAFDALVRRLLDALARERANSAHIAHELRTPLTSILAELDTVPADDAATRGAVVRIRSDVARLTDVIEAILVLSTTRAPVRGARVDAPMNLADLVRQLAPSDARLQVPDEALVEGDERLVALALRNLLDNARKYGKGARLIRVEREADRVRLAVVDRGAGLDDEARSRMFDRYWRASADGDGRGLGLALVRAVAERHGGQAEANPGHGGGLDVSMTLGAVVGWHEHAPRSG
jgi:signal transduction histidine kinase